MPVCLNMGLRTDRLTIRINFQRSKNLNLTAKCYGFKFGADRDRTDDLLLAKQALSQLSYSPLLS